MAGSKKSSKSASKRPTGSKTVGSASAAAILGRPAARKGASGEEAASTPIVQVKSEWAKYHKRLVDLREQLVSQIDGLAKESAEEMAGYSLHMADSGTDNYDRDFALSLLSSDQDALFEIDEAIRRIGGDTYGVCEITGEEIPKARLDAIPWTRYTVQAQAQLEKEGMTKKRALGQLGTLEGGSGGSQGDGDDDDTPTPPKGDDD